MEGGTLKTMSLMNINGEQRWEETIIHLDRVIYVTGYSSDDYPDTCLIQY